MRPTPLTGVVLNSRNSKTGPVALLTRRTIDSCPTSCALHPDNWPERKGPCYAWVPGRGGRSIFDLAEEKSQIRGTDYTLLIDAIKKLPLHSVIRFNESGDYLLPDGSPDHEYIKATNTAYRHTVISYTHAWRKLKPEWFHDKTRPNASCDTIAEVPVARAMGWNTTLVIPEDAPTPEGCVVCPYSTNQVQCVKCQLCAKDRKTTVVFPAHGSRRKRIGIEFIHQEKSA